MKRNDFWKAYILLLIAQLIISNYFRFTPFVMLSILPVMILSVPIRVNRFALLLVAFASGLLVDWMSWDWGLMLMGNSFLPEIPSCV